MRKPTAKEINVYMNVCRKTGAANSRLVGLAAKFFHCTRKEIQSILNIETPNDYNSKAEAFAAKVLA